MKLLSSVFLVFAAVCAEEKQGKHKMRLAILPLMDAGKLTVCTDGAYPPFDISPTPGTGWTGFDFELIDQFSKYMATCEKGSYKNTQHKKQCQRVGLHVISIDFDGLWTGPIQGKCDIAVGAMTITEKRRTSALFSSPYHFDKLALFLAMRFGVGKLSINDLCQGRNGTLAYQWSTTGEDYVRDHPEDVEGCDLIHFPPTGEGLQEMFLSVIEGGDFHGVITDMSVGLDYTGPDDQHLLFSDVLADRQEFGFSFANTKDGLILLDFVNQLICRLHHRRQYVGIYNRWVYEDELPPTMPPLLCDYELARRFATDHNTKHGGNYYDNYA